VTKPDILQITSYVTHQHRAAMLGTAIVARNWFLLTNIAHYLPGVPSPRISVEFV
jgi:hypothetical protein